MTNSATAFRFYKPVGFGIFMWSGTERQTDRYGGIYLSDSNFDNTATVEARLALLDHLIGKRVKVWCRVVETRKSGHMGDKFLQIVPTQPRKDAVIDVGVGILSVEPLDYKAATPAIVLRPNDGRRKFWIDPRNLFRLHDQTVELFVEETTDDFSPVYEAPDTNGTGSIANGDGSFQMKGPALDPSKKYRVSPHVERLGDGAFIMGGKHLEDERVKITEDKPSIGRFRPYNLRRRY